MLPIFRGRLGTYFTHFLKSRVALVGGAAILSVLIFGWCLAKVVVGYGEDNERYHLLVRAATAACTFDPATVASLSGRHDDVEKPNYERVRARLVRIRNTNPDARFVYLMAPKGEEVIFLADAEPATSEDYSAPGDIYDEGSPQLHKIFSDGKAFIEGPFEDRWGVWVTGLAPIVDPQTKAVIAVLGMDIDARKWRQTIGVYSWFTMITTGLLALIVLTFSVAMSRINQANKRITECNRELEERVDERTAKLTMTTEQLNLELTERKRAEETLRESQRWQKAILDNIPDIAWLKDREGKFIAANESLGQACGVKPEDLVGKTDFDIWQMDLAEKYGSDDKEVIQSGKRKQVEEPLVDKDGKTTWIETIKTPIWDDRGELVGITGIARDITERKQVEKDKRNLEVQLQQAQKMEAIGTLAGGIAHDFNNILSAIIGYSELEYWNAREKGQTRSNLDQVLKAADRAKNLVEQILTFSRQTEQEPRPLQIGPIVKETLKLIRASLPTTIEICKKDVKQESGTVLADPTQIHQVLMNLCTNAAHAMREKGGVMGIGLLDVDLNADDVASNRNLKPGSYVRLSVSDTGHGIEPEFMDRIFDPYFTTKGVGEGTGLGLSVVHGIVKSHGGMITVDSKLGKGTTFSVYFPRTEMEVAPKPEAFEPLPTGHERIFVIDDEEAILEIEKHMLQRLGYEVTATTNPIEALETFRAQSQKIDLVVTDQTMPHMTGEMFCKEIMSIRPDIPIILCTGFSELITEEEARTIGIREFVMKPFEIRDIATTIRRVLDRG
jgi:PAS domain S-box-containing protein